MSEKGTVVQPPDEKIRVRMASEGYKAIENMDADDRIPLDEEHRSKSHGRSERQLWAVVAVCLLIIIALVIVIIVTHIRVDRVYKQCQTPTCIKAAGEILARMDLSAPPCDDFYTYACGGWEKNALPPPDKPKWNAFSEVYQENIAVLNKLINRLSPPCPYKGKKSTAICKARDYYLACQNVSAIEHRGNAPVLKFIKDLYSWTLTDNPDSGHWNEKTWNFIDVLVKMNSYGVYPLFQVAITTDDKNSSQSILFMEQNGLTLGDTREYNNSNSEKYHTAFVGFLTRLATLLGATNVTDVIQKAEQIWDFEKKLASIFVPKAKLQDAVATYHKMTVADVTKLMNSTINIKKYFDKVFHTSIPPTEDLLVPTPTYFTALAEVLRTVDKRVLANYMMTHAVFSVLPYLPEAFMEAVLILKKATMGVSSLPPRWEICVKRIDDVFGFATGALYVQEKFSQESKNRAAEIIENVRQAFIQDLPGVKWMDDKTRKVAAEKARAVMKMIGYPDWILDPAALDKYYDKISVTSDQQFENAIQAKIFFHNKMLMKRGKVPDRKEWHMMPSTVNAYYNAEYNEIVFPAGILQKPFYSPDFPTAHNFGAMGSVSGHEFTHGFDTRGSKYDKFGNMRNWWTEKSEKEFKKKTSCMEKQYDQYTFGGHKVNGLTTLGENIADNGGLKSAYKAFSSWNTKHGMHKQVSLPGLNMTDSQLFFLGFGQIWCAYYTPDYARTSLLTDEHAPPHVRVVGALSNNPDFAVAFGCKTGSKMNPEKKCQVW